MGTYLFLLILLRCSDWVGFAREFAPLKTGLYLFWLCFIFPLWKKVILI